MSAFVDRTGWIIGRLTVLSVSDKTGSRNRRFWNCKCECGKELAVQASCLISGTVRSCGCFQKEAAAACQFRHGASTRKIVLPEYSVWASMKRRCSSEKDPAYKNYGGRGIKVCEPWLDFKNFIKDMGLRPSENHTLERKNNELGYEPSNCVWATRMEQGSNRRNNKKIEFQGQCLTYSEWARKSGISQSQIGWRIKSGWNPIDAISVPTRRKSSGITISI